LRIATPAIYYVAHGLPIGLFYAAILPWATSAGMTPADVGQFVALLSLPWGAKIVVAIIMDRFSGSSMGRRRPWLIASNLIVVLGLAAGAIVAPGPLDFAWLGLIALSVSVGCATLDTAADGLAVEALQDNERGTASALMYGGQALGLAAGAALGSTIIAAAGLQAAFAIFAGLSLPFLLHSIAVREADNMTAVTASANDKRAHAPKSWTDLGRALLDIVTAKNSLLLLAASAIGGIIGGIFNALWPLLAIREFGIDKELYGQLVAYALVGGALVAMPLGHLLVRYLGLKLAAVAAFAGFAILALALALLGRQGGSFFLFGVLTFAWISCDLLTSICLNPLRLMLSAPIAGATQFTAYTSVSNMTKPLGSLIAGAAFGSGMTTGLLWIVIALACFFSICVHNISVKTAR
jgi:PAT family beta-lactamase induction signal transducer AmpG